MLTSSGNLSPESQKSIHKLIVCCLVSVFFLMPFNDQFSLRAQELSFEAESGISWFGRNDVRIPNEDGTLFDMIDLIGTEPYPFLRLRANLELGERHLIRVLYAPLSQTDTGEFEDEVFFEETSFQPNTPTEGTYRFNTYRLTYRYTFYQQSPWELGAGAAVLVRDAKVELEQTDRTDRNTDLGIVPLIHLFAKGSLTDQWSVSTDIETLASPQGRATDGAISVNYTPGSQITISTGYRVIEGGADVDEVYNFAWINFGFVGVRLEL